jgi:hypothetical protein
MTYENITSGDGEYFSRLPAEERRDELQAETVSADSRATMVEQVVSPELQGGLYVEIGFGAAPYAVKTSRVFTEASRYVGMDGGVSDYYVSENFGWGAANGPYSERTWRRAMQKFSQSDNASHSLLVRGDAQHMPLPDASDAQWPVREIYLGDVLITPGVHHQSQLRIFKECARVIDPDGYLIIRESDMHLMNFHSNRRQLELLAALTEAGFNRRIWINDDPSVPRAQLLALAKQFGQSDPYDTYVIAQLGEAESQQKPSGRVLARLSSLLKRSGVVS